MVEQLDLPCIPLVIANLRLNLMVGDRVPQPRGANLINCARGTTHRPPDAARVPIDPALGHRIGLCPRRVGRGNAEQLERAHWPQPFCELAIVEPSAVPLLPLADDRIEHDCDRDQQLECCLLELYARRHEGPEAEAHRDPAEDEVEDVPAAIGLREMGSKPVRPAIRLFEQIDRRREIVRLDAADPVATPFVPRLGVRMFAREIARPEPPHASSGQQKRVFDAGANPSRMLPQKALEKSLFVLIRWRHEQSTEQCIDIAALEWPGDGGIVCHGDHGRIECTPQNPGVATAREWHVHDRCSACQCQLHDFARPTATARREAVPDGNQHVAMRNCGAAGHYVGFEAMIRVAWQLEQAGGTSEQGVEPLARAVIGEARAVSGTFERQDRLQLPPEFERDFGGDLVCAVRHGRNETEAWRGTCETVTLHVKQLAAGLLDQHEHVADALAQHRHAVLRQHLGAMAGNSDGKDERNWWRKAIGGAAHLR